MEAALGRATAAEDRVRRAEELTQLAEERVRVAEELARAAEERARVAEVGELMLGTLCRQSVGGFSHRDVKRTRSGSEVYV